MSYSSRTVIIEMHDKDINHTYVPEVPLSEYHVRKAARGLVIHNQNVALLHVTKGNYHKLPGGGIDVYESLEEGFRREVLEETGRTVTITSQDAITIEYWDSEKELQLSYVFTASVVGKPRATQFTENEINNGFQLHWVPFEEVYHVISKDMPMTYEGKYIQHRDRAIIHYYKDLLR